MKAAHLLTNHQASRRAMTALIALGIFLATPALAQSAEFVEQADVVRIEPVASDPIERRCTDAKPATAASSSGLVDMLRWDLCRDVIQPEPSGYRVYYRWDDRTYSRVMPKRPGPTVPILVRFE